MKIKIFWIGIVSIFLFLLSFQLAFPASITTDRAIQIARTMYYEVIPMEYRNQFQDVTSSELFAGEYLITWQRKINGIPVYGDKFLVRLRIDGSIINNEFIYTVNASDITDLSPTITKEQAEMVVLDAYGGEIMKAPYLVIHGKDLLWDMTLSFPESVTYGVIPTVKLGIDSDTGETKYFNPSLGSGIQQVPTSFDPAKYPQPINWYGLAIMGLIIAGCAICIGKDKLRRAIGMTKNYVISKNKQNAI